MDSFLNALVTLFVTIDPIGLAPIFVVLTLGMSPAERRRTALRAALAAGTILVAFALLGEPLLDVLGISLPAFRIAGGILLFWIAFEMVFEWREQRKSAAVQTARTAEERHDLAIFPLAIPLIAGPGAISATILIAAQSRTIVGMGGLILVIVGLIASCLGVFLLADLIEKALGPTGRIVLSRLLGVILSALAVQFVADGVTALVRA